LAIQPLDAFVIGAPALAAQHQIKHGAPPTASLFGQLAQALSQFIIAILRRGPSETASCDADQPTRATLRQSMGAHDFRHDRAFHRGPYPFFASTSFSARMSSAWSKADAPRT
jgi:hypothetical protein